MNYRKPTRLGAWWVGLRCIGGVLVIIAAATLRVVLWTVLAMAVLAIWLLGAHAVAGELNRIRLWDMSEVVAHALCAQMRG